MNRSYDTVAPFYDCLAHLVFGKSILSAQKFLINYIPSNSTVLIIGGGSGNVLREITAKHPRGLKITYVDSSQSMIKLSKKHSTGENVVTFINEPFQTVTINYGYDVVITEFFFDNFLPATAHTIFNKVNNLLKPGGMWLYSDFVIDNHAPLWQKLLLKTMYAFFRMFTNIEAASLPEVSSFFSSNDYNQMASENFYKGFIRSVLYRKGN